MTFVTGARVLVRQADDESWTLEEEVVYEGRSERFVVPVGTRTDFASVPRVFVWLVPEFGRYTAPAVLHDHVVRVERPAGRISAVDADGLFRRAMRELGVPFLLRWFMWAAVRWGSLTEAPGRVGWLRDLPRVALVTVVALPVVTVPAVMVLLGLALYMLLEYVVWGVLLVGRGDGEVNRPRPRLRT